MAFTPTLKQIDQVKVQITPFQKVTEIMSPHEEWKPAGYLQIVRTDTMNEEPFVVEGGDIVAISARTEARFVNRLDIANFGAATAITYTAADVAAGRALRGPGIRRAHRRQRLGRERLSRRHGGGWVARPCRCEPG